MAINKNICIISKNFNILALRLPDNTRSSAVAERLRDVSCH